MIRVLTLCIASTLFFSTAVYIGIPDSFEEDEKLIEVPRWPHRIDRKGKVVVAVIDTGFNDKYERQVTLCKTGHMSFTGDDNPTSDEHGHGTHIAGLVAKNAKTGYCIMVMKYYSKEPYQNLLHNTIAAFRWAIEQNVDIINYSGGGKESSKAEKAVIKEALDKNIVVVAAAGNNGDNLGTTPYYPAMYYNDIIVAGNKRSPSSNYGKGVDVEIDGTNVRSVNGIMTGTSQSTAIMSGLIVKHVKSFRHVERTRKERGHTRDGYYTKLYNYMGR